MVMFALALPTQNLSYFLFTPFLFFTLFEDGKFCHFQSWTKEYKKVSFRLIVK